MKLPDLDQWAFVAVPRRNLNALRPGGPRTDQGKAISSANSLKHGLTARQREADLLEVSGDLFTSNHPHLDFERLVRYMGAIEHELNKVIVRLDHLQAARLNHQQMQQPGATTPANTEPPKVLTATASAPSSPAASEFVLSQPESAARRPPKPSPNPPRNASPHDRNHPL
jgi:hypothetical protein